jgi:quercetin dioxygenase-like cupin family protein
MRHLSATAAVSLALALGLTIGGAGLVYGTQTSQHDASIHTPDKIAWRDGPPSLPTGAQFAVIDGDPAKDGEFFAMRLRLPDGYRIPPHWHPVTERVTVISGTFHLGHGETFDAENMQALEAGSYFAMPPKMRHFARAEGETVVQINTIGPWDIQYVNPQDDPRKPMTTR